MGSLVTRLRISLVLGLAAFWTWTHLLVFVPGDWLAEGTPGGWIWTASNAVSFLSLTAVYGLARMKRTLFDSRQLLLGVAAVAGLSSIGVFSPAPLVGLSVTSLMLASASNMAFIGIWATRFARMRSIGEQTGVTLLSMLASFVSYIVLSRVTPSFVGVIMLALVAVSTLCLLSSSNAGTDGPHGERGTSRASERRDNMRTRPPLLVLGYILIFSIPLNYLQGNDFGINPMRADFGYDLVFAAAIGILGTVCLLEIAAMRKGLSVLPSATVLLLSAALLGASFVAEDSSTFVSTCTIAGYFLFLSVTYLQLGRVVIEDREKCSNAPAVFSAGMLANASGLLLGSLLGVVSHTLSPTIANVVTTVIVYGLFLLGLALLPQRMKSVLLGRREEKERPLPQNQYVVDMVSSINAQCARVAACFGLTQREQSVLGYLVRGWSLQMIAEEEHLTRNTVKTHVTHIYQKLGVHTREEMALLVERLDACDRRSTTKPSDENRGLDLLEVSVPPGCR